MDRLPSDSSGSPAGHPRVVDDQPGLEVHHPSPGDRGTTAPEVYWAEDANPSQYTFYREGTPTPQEEKTVQDDHARDSVAAYETTPVQQPRTRHGITRKAWAVIIIIIMIILFAIGIGVGVGVTVSRRSSGDAAAAETSAPSSNPTASSGSGVATTTTPWVSPSSTSTAVFDCPASNDTYYTARGSDKKFHRICGIDYGGTNEANDLGHVATESMTECIDQCAIFPGCTGCAWGFIKGDKGPKYRCWMKNSLRKSHLATPEWAFAILQ